jgi:hypothetical protein
MENIKNIVDRFDIRHQKGKKCYCTNARMHLMKDLYNQFSIPSVVYYTKAVPRYAIVIFGDQRYKLFETGEIIKEYKQ